MFLAKVAVNRPILTTMGILVFIIFGILAFTRLNLNLMPDIEIPFVTISTVYPGAGPKEVETLITKKIEDAVATISEIDKLESYSLDGLSIVIIQFKLSKNINVANQEVKDKVDPIINQLPSDALKPIVQKVDFKAFPIIDVVLSGDLDPRDLYEIADKTLKERFSQIQGVANVNVIGGQEREIKISLDNKIAFENAISLPQLLNILRAHNMDIPGGYLKYGDQEYTVRLSGEFNDLETIREIEIPTPFGLKKLRQIANVRDDGKEIRQRTVFYDNIEHIKDENVVRLGIIKSPEGNVVTVAENVKKILPEIEKVLPAGCKLKVVNDESGFIRSTVDDTMSNIILGIIFTSIVLFMFLNNIKSTIIVALSMPTSIISTFLLMQFSGVTLNMMSLMGLSVSVGVLVANSVVVIENIFRYKAFGVTNKEAAYKGTSEVTVAVLAATLTNLVVFIPIANMSSMVGMFLKELALSATFATIFSLIFSFTLTPMLSSLILSEQKEKNFLAKFFEKFENGVYKLYSIILQFVLKNKLVSALVIVATFFIFVFTSWYYGSKIGFEFIPQFDDGRIKVEIELPQGYNLDMTSKVVNQIESIIKKHPEVERILSNIGRISNLDIGANMAVMDIQLVDAKYRQQGLAEWIGIFTRELADIPNAKIIVDYGRQMGGGGKQIQFYILGQDLEILDELKSKIHNELKTIPGLINFENSSRAGKQEITVYPNRQKLSEAQLTIMDLAFTLRSSIEGIESSKFRQEGNEYDITVTLDEESTNTPDKIAAIPIISPVAGAMRLSDVADIEFTSGFSRILHFNKYTAISFSGSPAAGVPLGNVTTEIEKRLANIEFPAGYSWRWGGNTEMFQEMILDMLFAFIIAVLLTYMLLAAILESFIQPIFIMLTIPLALIGVFIFLYYTQISLGISSLMGVIMLIGIVVNNAILLLDYANQLRREQGLSAKDAILESGPIKLKPIIMSTTALILGMLPMALGFGDAGKEMRIPLGVVSIGGLLVSTALTLIVIPAFYYLTSRKKK